VAKIPDAATVLDLFSGTSRVGHALKAAGYRVLANDHNAYAHTLATCYVQADREEVFERAEMLIAELNGMIARLPGPAEAPDIPAAAAADDPIEHFVQTYCIQSRYFHPANGRRIAMAREAIARKAAAGLDPELQAVVMVSLLEAADRVDSTTGVQMAYLKSWAPRALTDLRLRMPAILPRSQRGKGQAHALDALDAARALSADIAYIDPPYNQHSYLGNYHVWETLVRWDSPEVYGRACKRIDCRLRRSDYNSRLKIHAALEHLLEAVQARTLIVSFSNEGYITPQQMEMMLARRGQVQVIEFDYKRYIGAQIGIYSPRGEKVGRISHLRNKELLYIVRMR
jgi:adenine-specific DNA-methyltransferase